ncbi:hypothetical protein [Teichococcus deserti]|uniref:hypothetical protein n=1 Tax=Teichococcus deserti TaxID=1817963 RepID=UPI0010551EFE|nr:hypothetical protein [Pseudoroseomonas deserti]
MEIETDFHASASVGDGGGHRDLQRLLGNVSALPPFGPADRCAGEFNAGLETFGHLLQPANPTGAKVGTLGGASAPLKVVSSHSNSQAQAFAHGAQKVFTGADAPLPRTALKSTQKLKAKLP